jgi:uracil-DNA glycosylase
MLLKEVRACTICAEHLALGPRPVLQADARARILVAGQAPGRKVHDSGMPFDDASGEQLRQWMGSPSKSFPNCSEGFVASSRSLDSGCRVEG